MKKRANKYDILISELIEGFSKIPNFQAMYEDEDGNKVFKFIIKRVAEISSFKKLFLHNYIPETGKAIAEDINSAKTSRYSHLLNIDSEELKENYYEIIRLGYVGMFHKYENYLRELVKYCELVFSNSSEKEHEETLQEYAKRVFQFKLIDWQNSSTTSRINWICNSIKHHDGYPNPNAPTPKEHEYLPKTEKLKFTKEDFSKDIDSLVQIYTLMLQLFFSIAYAQSLDKEANDAFHKEYIKSNPDPIAAFNDNIKSFIEAIKQK